MKWLPACTQELVDGFQYCRREGSTVPVEFAEDIVCKAAVEASADVGEWLSRRGNSTMEINFGGLM